MDGFCAQGLVLMRNSILHVLIDVLSYVGSNARHHDCGAEKDIKQSVQTGHLILNSFFTLHSGPVEPDIPVG